MFYKRISIISREVIVAFDPKIFVCSSPNFSARTGRNEFSECLAFLNTRGDDLLSKPLPQLTGWHKACLMDPTRTCISLVRLRRSHRLVGIALLKISYDWRKVVGDVEYVLVDPHFRGDGSGLGRAVMEHLLEQAKKMKVDVVKLISEPDRIGARILYGKLGFVLMEGSDRHFSLDLR
jgi:ribosomal protein S18 acetylase RimI-like enzyme